MTKDQSPATIDGLMVLLWEYGECRWSEGCRSTFLSNRTEGQEKYRAVELSKQIRAYAERLVSQAAQQDTLDLVYYRGCEEQNIRLLEALGYPHEKDTMVSPEEYAAGLKRMAALAAQEEPHPLDVLLPDICQLLDTVKTEWIHDGSWSAWDQSVRDRIAAYNLGKFAAPAQDVQPQQMPVAPASLTGLGTDQIERRYPTHGAPVIYAAPVQEAQPQQEPARETFCWLVELFATTSGNSMGYYHTGFVDLDGNSRSTRDPYQAWRYDAREAQLVSSRLLHKAGVWRAVEHGFSSAPAAFPTQPQQKPVAWR